MATKHIYLFEDDKDIAELITILLSDIDLECLVASTVESSLELAQKQRPDLIVLDYWLGGTKADNLVRNLKSSKNLSSVPIVLVSAVDNLEEVGAKLKVDAIIKKPFDITDFQTTVKNLLF